MDTPPAIPPQPRFRFLWLCAICLILLDQLVRLGAPIWCRYSPDEYRERIDHCAEHQRDVVFLGGSPIAEGIDPSLFVDVPWREQYLQNGYSVGLSGGTTSDFYFALKQACPKPPRLLIYGITASDLNDRRHEPHGAHSILTWADWQDWRRTRPESSGWVTRHYLRGQASHLFATFHFQHGIRLGLAEQFHRWFPGSATELATEAKRQRQMHTDLQTGNGYVPTTWFAHRQYSQMKASGWVAPPFAYFDNYQLGSHWKYLEKIQQWCIENQVELILVDMPVTMDLETRHPEVFAKYRQNLLQWTQEKQVAIIWAKRESTSLGDPDFADLIHLNSIGAKRFSHWLAEKLTHDQPSSPTVPAMRHAIPGAGS